MNLCDKNVFEQPRYSSSSVNAPVARERRENKTEVGELREVKEPSVAY